jgi:hypothetical protein
MMYHHSPSECEVIILCSNFTLKKIKRTGKHSLGSNKWCILFMRCLYVLYEEEHQLLGTTAGAQPTFSVAQTK